MVFATSCSRANRERPENGRDRSSSTAWSLDRTAVVAWAVTVALVLLLRALSLPPDDDPGASEDILPRAGHSRYGDGRELLFFRPLDLNSVTAEELTLVPGIGAARAWSIVEFRQGVGFLLSVEELAAPEGPLRPDVFRAVAPFLGVGDPPAEAPEAER